MRRRNTLTGIGYRKIILNAFFLFLNKLYKNFFSGKCSTISNCYDGHKCDKKKIYPLILKVDSLFYKSLVEKLIVTQLESEGKAAF